ncbi:hypothetical protein D1007_49611 [Hordeum vulgare]|nr:hypothetical protein D1007_49611 [Hordeum vulgare]
MCIMGHFKSECKNFPKEKALMAQQGDEGDMMLMYELVDEEDPVLQGSTKEIGALREGKVCSQDHDSKTRVDAMDAGGDSETYTNATGVSAIFAGAKEALIACARPWRSDLVTNMRDDSKIRVEATNAMHKSEICVDATDTNVT